MSNILTLIFRAVEKCVSDFFLNNEEVI